MLGIAIRARDLELFVIGSSIRDRSGYPLGEEANDLASALLGEALKAGDLQTALDALEGDRGPYQVPMLRFFAPYGSEVYLFDDGATEARGGDEAETLLRPLLP